MGWLFCAETKEALVNRLIQAEENEKRSFRVVDHRVVGSKLWMVVEYTAKMACAWFGGQTAEPGETFLYIRLALLSSDRKREYNRWGYNEYSEADHPYHYSCPLKFLELAPEECQEWRAKVREYHAEKRTTPAWKTWKIGDVVEAYEKGKLYTICSPRISKGRVQRHVGWNVRRVSDGKLFRLDRYALREGVVVKSGGGP